MSARHRFTILGCGSSGGVPRVGGDWGRCDPSNPKNRRRRCSLLVERFGTDGVTRVVIDSGPDMREQLLDAGVGHLDGVLYTHPHADHIHGIDDLRGLALAERRRVDVYADANTEARLREAFRYCFERAHGSDYPPILTMHRVSAGQGFAIQGAGGPVTVLPFAQVHGNIPSLGYRIADVAYSSDLNGLPAETLPLLRDLAVWIIDALRWSRHSSHFTVNEALEWIGKLEPQHAILTNMHQDLDYEELREALPEGVEPAYDMMTFEVPEPAVRSEPTDRLRSGADVA